MAENAFRIFLDTNVLLSGFLSITGAPRLILDILASDQSLVEAATGQYNILEVERNVERKLSRLAPVYEEILAKIRLIIVPLPTSAETEEARWAAGAAQKDLAVLVSAANWRANFLITGDKKHFDRYKAGKESLGDIPFRVVSPAELVDNVLREAFGKMRPLRSP